MSADQELVSRYIQQSQAFQSQVSAACGDNTQIREEVMNAFKMFHHTALELDRKLQIDPAFAQTFQQGLAKIDPTKLPKL